MADQILSLFVGKVVDYLAVLVGDQFSYFSCYNGNLEEFKSRLRSLEIAGRDVKLLVQAAERKGEVILPSVEDWLTMVDGIMNEWKPFVEEEDAISKWFFNGPSNLIVRYHRSRRAKWKALEFDAIEKRSKFDPVSCLVPQLQTELISNENEFDFESRRSVFHQIIDTIEDDGVRIMMSGIEKITLVKRVGKYAKDEGLFQMVAMAVVSLNQSIEAIQGQITDLMGLKFTSESRGGRAGPRERYVLILDNIWVDKDHPVWLIKRLP